MYLTANNSPKPQRIIKRTPITELWLRILQEKQKLMMKKQEIESEASAGTTQVQEENQFMINNPDFCPDMDTADDCNWIMDETWEKWETEAKLKFQDIETEEKMDEEHTQSTKKNIDSKEKNMPSNDQHEPEPDNNAAKEHKNLLIPFSPSSHNDRFKETDDERKEMYDKDVDNICKLLNELHLHL